MIIDILQSVFSNFPTKDNLHFVLEMSYVFEGRKFDQWHCNFDGNVIL